MFKFSYYTNLIIFLCSFVLYYQRNDEVVLLSFHGRKDCAIGNFVKFGGGATMHLNCAMLGECISIATSSCLLVGAHMPYLKLDHNPSFHFAL